MKEIPILFSTQMVKAILEGRKTQTRRLVKPQPDDGLHNDTLYPRSIQSTMKNWNGQTETGQSREWKCRYGEKGDRIWVRESSLFLESHPKPGWIYKTDSTPELETSLKKNSYRWRPSIHMRKEAARIWLQVENIRVERVADISEADAMAEGASRGTITDEPKVLKSEFQLQEDIGGTCKDGFKFIWSKVNTLESWYSNHWVWVIEFKVLSTTGKP